MSGLRDGKKARLGFMRVMRVSAAITMTVATAALVSAQIQSPDVASTDSANSVPIAHAGSDQAVVVGQNAVLDASKSADLDGDRLEFYWSLSNSPNGSLAELIDPFSLQPSVYIDLPGTYEAMLVVHDGNYISPPASVRLSTTNSAPFAHAGPDRTAQIGDVVVLDAGKSHDPDGDPLVHAWQLIEFPAGSDAVLLRPNSQSPSFDVDRAGRYVARLIVNDGRLTSQDDKIVVSTVNSPPVALPGNNLRVTAGQRIELNGHTSTDPDRDPLSFAWSVLSLPLSSSARLADPSAATTQLYLDQPGLYLIQLIVSDGRLFSAPESIVIEAIDAGTNPISPGKSDNPPEGPNGPSMTTSGSSVQSTPSAGVTDTDGDGVDDPVDNCLAVPNATQLDTDFDGYGNACDADLNNDGIVNFADLSQLEHAFFSTPGDPNWNPNADLNGDNTVNFGDLNILRSSFFMQPGPSGRDADGDGIPDASDNCRDIANSDQLDTDSDRFGNVCDADLNNDGVINFVDLEVMRNAFFSTPASINWNADADLNGDGSVNFADLAIMEAAFFQPPGPSGLLPLVVEFDPLATSVGNLVNVIGANFVTEFGFVPKVVLQKQGGGTIDAPIGRFDNNNIAFTIPPGTADGVITVVVKGESSASVEVLDILPSSDFTIVVGPDPAHLMQGQTVSYAVTLGSINGFPQLADLQVSGVPAGLTASFDPPVLGANQTSILKVADPDSLSTPSTTNLVITASATVDGFSVSDSKDVQLEILPVSTSFIGQAVVADTLQSPLAGVTITFLGLDNDGVANGCNATTVSDAAGNFMLLNLPPECLGLQLVRFDGLSASNQPGQYAGVDLIFLIEDGQVTVSPVLIHLPRIDNAETVCVVQNATVDQTFTFETIPNLTVLVYAGTTFTPPISMPLHNCPAPITFPLIAVQVPVDRLPDEMPANNDSIMPFIVAFQPAGASTDIPVPVFFPNVMNTPPGINMALSTLDPTEGVMVDYGTGTVSSDGRQVVPDFDPTTPGRRFGLSNFDWHGQRNPPPPQVPPCPFGTCCARAGDPIVIGSGLQIVSETDISINSPRGAVSVQRTYRTLSDEAGPFGIGGNHNYGFRLDTNAPQSAAVVNLIFPDGNRFPFAFDGVSVSTNSTIPGLRGTVLSVTPTGESSLRWKDGTIFRFIPGSFVLGSVLESITDSNGNRIAFTRNPSNLAQIIEISDPIGRKLFLSYDSADRITSIIDPIGRQVLYTYNALGALETVTDPAGGVTEYAYETATRLSQITDARGVIVAQNTYDANGRVIEQIQADGGVITFDYVLLNPDIGVSPVQKTVVTDARGNQTVYRFNPQGFLIDVTDSLGQTRVFEREAGTNLLMTVTGAGSCSICGNTAAGDVFSTYDTAGNLLSSTDALGNSTTYTYDPIFNKLASTTNSIDGVSTFAYDGFGNLLTQTDENNRTTTFAYNRFGEVITITDPLDNMTTLSYDAVGVLNSVTDPLGNTTAYIYDPAYRVNETIDPVGNRTLAVYDDHDRVVSVTDPNTHTTLTSYDEVGNIILVTDARDNTISFAYDSMNRLDSRMDSRGKADNRSYDPNGNLTQFVDRRGQVSTFSYDELNRLVTEEYQDGSMVNRDYDSHGQIVMAADSRGGTFSFRYDPTGRLQRSVGPFGVVNYQRDELGRVGRRHVVGQPAVDYAYDAAGNLKMASMPEASISYTYDETNRLSNATRTNGVSTNYTYDDADRVLSIQHERNGGIIKEQAYTYDARGNRIGKSSNLALPLTSHASVSSYAEDSNFLLQSDVTNYTHDDNGNRLIEIAPSGTTTYDWDSRNRLNSITTPSDMTVFHYDYRGNLIGKDVTIDGSTGPVVMLSEQYILDDITNVTFISRSDGLQTSVLTGQSIDEHLAIVRSTGQIEYALQDAINSTIVSVNGIGIPSAAFQYEPFGQTEASGSTFPFAFTGRVPISETLYHYRARYYDTQTRRFISEDPIGLLGGMNLFLYTQNNPVNYTDPTGLKLVEKCKLICLACVCLVKCTFIEIPKPKNPPPSPPPIGGPQFPGTPMLPPPSLPGLPLLSGLG